MLRQFYVRGWPNFFTCHVPMKVVCKHIEAPAAGNDVKDGVTKRSRRRAFFRVQATRTHAGGYLENATSGREQGTNA